MVLVHISKVAKEQVDGDVVAAAAPGRADPQVAVIGGQAVGWRNDIDVITLDRYRLAYLAHRHSRDALDQAVCLALVVRRQVQHYNERHAAVFGDALKKRLDRLQAAGRCTDTHHWEVQMAGA
ncbi:hypothetical protein D3C81_1014260 [compost metagenome]